jgi:hypothetical protein
VKAIDQPLLLRLGKVPEARLPPQGVRLLLRRKFAMLLPPLREAVATPRRRAALPVIRPLLIAQFRLVLGPLLIAQIAQILAPLLPTVFLAVIGPLRATHFTTVFLLRSIVRLAPVLLPWGPHLAPAAILKSPVGPVEIVPAVAAIFMRLGVMSATPVMFTALGPAERRRH